MPHTTGELDLANKFNDLKCISDVYVRGQKYRATIHCVCHADCRNLMQRLLAQDAVWHQEHQHGPAPSEGCKRQQYATSSHSDMQAAACTRQ